MAVTPSDDLLQVILEAYALEARIYASPRLCGRWQGVHPSTYQATFHLISQGACWLHMRQLPQAIALNSGDLVLLPRDDWHVLSSEPEPHGEAAIYGDLEGPVTAIVCGEINFRPQQENLLLDAMPDLVLIRCGDRGGEIDLMAQLLSQEVDRGALGNELVQNRLAEALFVLIVRHYLKSPGEKKGLLAALTDARLSRALMAIHRTPEERWQVGSLARVAGMSRTVFAQRFVQVMNQTPIEYLTRWRMQLAQQWLREHREPVNIVAKKLGYETETAFRRAFQRVTGMTPGRLRRPS